MARQELGTPVRIYFYTVSTLFLHNSPQAIAKFFQLLGETPVEESQLADRFGKEPVIADRNPDTA